MVYLVTSTFKVSKLKHLVYFSLAKKPQVDPFPWASNNAISMYQLIASSVAFDVRSYVIYRMLCVSIIIGFGFYWQSGILGRAKFAVWIYVVITIIFVDLLVVLSGLYVVGLLSEQEYGRLDL